jgi:alpha-galactosidase
MILKVLLAFVAIVNAAPSKEGLNEDGHFEKRLNNGLGKTPALGWNGWVRPQIHFSVIPCC